MNSNNKTIEVLSWNVNGIRASEKKGFLDWLYEREPDVLCVQETKAHPEQLSENLLNPKGYFVDWCSAERKGYSGVATFSKKTPSQIGKGIDNPKYDSEGRVLVTEFDEFTLLNIYFPNGQRDEERLRYKLGFYDSVLEFMEKLRSQGQKLIVSGDYNTAHKPIDLARPKENEGVSGFLPIEREWLDKLVSHGYIDTLREFDQKEGLYTWWDMKSRARDRNVGWRIDYHFISEDLKPNLKNAYVMPEVFGSDHCPVGIELEF